MTDNETLNLSDKLKQIDFDLRSYPDTTDQTHHKNPHQLGDSSSIIVWANHEGLDVVFPEWNELQLDIDNEADYERFLRVIPIVSNYFTVEKCVETLSRSGLPKRHITLTLAKDVSNPLLRIALQACLGSDGMREFLSLVFYEKGDSRSTLFFEKRGELQTKQQGTLDEISPPF